MNIHPDETPPIDNIVGPPVTGANFYGREREVAQLIAALQNQDVLLLGPRRIGKTSICHAVRAELAARGWGCIYIDVASCRDECDFLRKLLAGTQLAQEQAPGLVSRALDWANGFVERVKSVRIGIPGGSEAAVDLSSRAAEDWTVVGAQLIQKLQAAPVRWLIYVDELPIFLHELIKHDQASGVRRVRRFLDWFRNDLRQLQAAQPVRWLVSGSIGLDGLAQRHGMADSINSFQHRSLPAFDHPRALALLQRLASRYELSLSDAQLQMLIDGVRWLQPYYLQQAFSHLREAWTPGLPPSDDLIHAALERMSEPGADNDFHHWQKRLEKQLDAGDARHAAALLVSSCGADGATATALLDQLHQRLGEASAEEARARFVELRDVLLRDGYWQRSEVDSVVRYAFALEPLRRWWARRSSL